MLIAAARTLQGKCKVVCKNFPCPQASIAPHLATIPQRKALYARTRKNLKDPRSKHAETKRPTNWPPHTLGEHTHKKSRAEEGAPVPSRRHRSKSTTGRDRGSRDSSRRRRVVVVGGQSWRQRRTASRRGAAGERERAKSGASPLPLPPCARVGAAGRVRGVFCFHFPASFSFMRAVDTHVRQTSCTPQTRVDVTRRHAHRLPSTHQATRKVRQPVLVRRLLPFRR